MQWSESVVIPSSTLKRFIMKTGSTRSCAIIVTAFWLHATCTTSLSADFVPTLRLDVSKKAILPLQYVVIELTAKVAEAKPLPATPQEWLMGDPPKPQPTPSLFVSRDGGDFRRVDDDWQERIRVEGSRFPDADGDFKARWNIAMTRLEAGEIVFDRPGNYEFFAKFPTKGGAVLSNVAQVKVLNPDEAAQKIDRLLLGAAEFRTPASRAFARGTDQFVEILEKLYRPLAKDNPYRPVLEEHIQLAVHDLLGGEDNAGEHTKPKVTDDQQRLIDQARKTAQACVDAGDVPGATEAFRDLLSVNPGDALAWEALGDLAAREGNWITARLRYFVALRYSRSADLATKAREARDRVDAQAEQK
jgi:hypothetical protein